MGIEETLPLRQQLDLSGTWELGFDNNLRGLEENWHSGQWPAGIGVPIQVPGIWNLVYPTLEGVGYYKTTFECHPDWQGKVITLNFEGACYFTQAWLNGQYVGSHEGAYTPFRFDITSHIQLKDENILVVRVVSLSKTAPVEGMRLQESPVSKQGWYYTFGGLWGKVYLEILPRVFIQQVHISPELQNQRIQVDVAIHNHLPASFPCDCHLEVIAPDGQQVAGRVYQMTALPGTGNHSFTIPIRQPLAWSWKTPNLYRLKTNIQTEQGGSDALTTRFGMRDFTVRAGQFYLNGEPLFIRGILLQPDYPQTLIVPPDASMMEKEMRLAKDAGFNLIRVHIRPAAPGFLDLADESGMLVYAEASLAWIKDSPRLKDHAGREISEMIRRDYNHPSVVFWGVYNENPTASTINGPELLTIARSLDPSRVIVQDSGGSLAIDQDFGWIDRAYMLAERQVQPEKTIDIHLYLGGIPPKPVLKWLSALGSGAIPSSSLVGCRLGMKGVLEEFDRELRETRGKIFLSELGCGGIADLDATVMGFGEQADYQDACELRRLRDELQQGFLERHLDRIFGSVKSMVNQIQELQAVGEVRQLEAVLVNPRFSGFGITQLSDVAWECHAGILDMWRNPKPVYNALKRVNQPHCLILTPDAGVVLAGSTLAASLELVSQEPTPPQAQIELRLENSPGERLLNLLLPGEREAGIHPYPETRFVIKYPGSYRLYARLFVEQDTLAETNVPVLALQPDNPLQWIDKLCYVGSQAPLLGSKASNHLHASWFDLDLPILAALPGTLKVVEWEGVLNAVRQGRTVIIGALTPQDSLAVEMLTRLSPNLTLSPGIGSWNGCYHWIPANSLFKGVPAGLMAGEEYVDLLPHYVLDEMGGEVFAGSFTTTTNRRHEKHVLWYSDIEAVDVGCGKVIFCQQRIFDQNPGHPIAMQLASNLLQMVVENNEVKYGLSSMCRRN